MIRRIRKLLTGALVGIGLLAMAAQPATAHTTQAYTGWYVWQPTRAIYMYVGSDLVGSAKAEAVYRDTVVGRLYGFNAWGYIADWTNNGAGDCVELWMDFNGAQPHRNPTMMRHCNVGGDVYGEHYLISDPVLFSQAPQGWDMTVCRSVMDGWGAWHRSECTNELGHKPQAWVQDSSSNHSTDASNSGCISNYTDSRYEWGCKMYRHDA